jgi:23S rRNA (uracil1939-C5)-methyltransferase
VEAALARARAADAVVLDPPREGCGAGVLQAMLHAATPQVVVYVSCNPATLARDVRIVARRGYEVDSVQPVDMFPHTPHIETVVVFRRGTP